jgi:hypothetical protein
MRILPFAAAAVLLLAACSPPAPLGPQPVDTTLGPPLTADQVRQEIVGNTGIGTRTGTKTIWSMYVDPNGTLRVTGAQPEETGSWRIGDDGRFCVKLQRTWNGQELCQSVHKAGAGLVLNSALSREEMTFLPGNKL